MLLDRRGQTGPSHRCFSLPFDKKLRKKKKYREAKKRLKENPEEKTAVIDEHLPLFEDVHEHNDPRLKNSYRTMCRVGKAPWRHPKHDIQTK